MTVTINGNGTITPTSAIQPAGSILQVLSNVKDDTSSTASTSFVDIGLSQAITPASTSSKIFIIANVALNDHHAVLSLNLMRDSTNICQPATDPGQNMSAVAYVSDETYMLHTPLTFLDSPNTTNEVTYKIQWKVNEGTGYLNRYSDADNWYRPSQLTLMEVAG